MRFVLEVFRYLLDKYDEESCLVAVLMPVVYLDGFVAGGPDVEVFGGNVYMCFDSCFKLGVFEIAVVK